MTLQQGRHPRRAGHGDRSNWFPTALAGFGVGCLVGAAVAMMVAPKSGRELREDLDGARAATCTAAAARDQAEQNMIGRRSRQRPRRRTRLRRV